MTDTAQGATLIRPLARADVALAVALAGLANGMASRAITSVAEMGWHAALFATFDISAIIWFGCFILVKRLLSAPRHPARALDLTLAAACALAFLLPVGQASWIALSIFALHLILSGPRSGLRAPGILLLAVCLPMFWARMGLSLFSGPLLNADAAMVAAVLGRPAVENTVPLADGSGVLWIAPACSSIINVALAVCCAALFVTLNGLVWTWRLAAWTLATCVAVAAVNIGRLCLLAQFPASFETLHGPEGGAGFALLILGVMVGMMALAVKHERAALA